MNRCRSETLVTLHVMLAAPLSANAIATGRTAVVTTGTKNTSPNTTWLVTSVRAMPSRASIRSHTAAPARPPTPAAVSSRPYWNSLRPIGPGSTAKSTNTEKTAPPAKPPMATIVVSVSWSRWCISQRRPSPMSSRTLAVEPMRSTRNAPRIHSSPTNATP